MSFPLSIWDVSLLLAIAAMVLLITSELLSPNYGKINLKISKKRLRNSALAVSILFLATVVAKIITIILSM
jgi:hypothetical protein